MNDWECDDDGEDIEMCPPFLRLYFVTQHSLATISADVDSCSVIPVSKCKFRSHENFAHFIYIYILLILIQLHFIPC